MNHSASKILLKEIACPVAKTASNNKTTTLFMFIPQLSHLQKKIISIQYRIDITLITKTKKLILYCRLKNYYSTQSLIQSY